MVGIFDPAYELLPPWTKELNYTYVLFPPTECTELQPLLSGVHSVMRVKFALAGEGGGCTPTPSHNIYHHQESCSVRSS
jgi:hypothetical protein